MLARKPKNRLHKKFMYHDNNDFNKQREIRNDKY